MLTRTEQLPCAGAALERPTGQGTAGSLRELRTGPSSGPQEAISLSPMAAKKKNLE